MVPEKQNKVPSSNPVCPGAGYRTSLFLHVLMHDMSHKSINLMEVL